MTSRWSKSDTARLEAFSDGVLAIAITLLILDIRLPVNSHNVGEDLLHAKSHYVAYATAFFTIAVLWVNHHDLFKLIDHADRGLMFLNSMLLLSISFLPFPTSVLAEHMDSNANDRQAALLAYGFTMVAIAFFYNTTWRYVRSHGLLRADLSADVIGRITRAYNPAILLYAAALPLSFFSAWFSIAVWLGLAVFFLLFGYEPEFADDDEGDEDNEDDS
ncbi:MAG: potassium channel family protein [Frankiales bacterium]|jgi:uncharacterized membrane protein|nr:potassium channel family protein [Frankiales bacterium]